MGTIGWNLSRHVGHCVDWNVKQFVIVDLTCVDYDY